MERREGELATHSDLRKPMTRRGAEVNVTPRPTTAYSNQGLLHISAYTSPLGRERGGVSRTFGPTRAHAKVRGKSKRKPKDMRKLRTWTIRSAFGRERELAKHSDRRNPMEWRERRIDTGPRIYAVSPKRELAAHLGPDEPIREGCRESCTFGHSQDHGEERGKG